MDYMYLKLQAVARYTITCMVVREAETRVKMAAAVPYKPTGTCISE